MIQQFFLASKDTGNFLLLQFLSSNVQVRFFSVRNPFRKRVKKTQIGEHHMYGTVPNLPVPTTHQSRRIVFCFLVANCSYQTFIFPDHFSDVPYLPVLPSKSIFEIFKAKYSSFARSFFVVALEEKNVLCAENIVEYLCVTERRKTGFNIFNEHGCTLPIHCISLIFRRDFKGLLVTFYLLVF